MREGQRRLLTVSVGVGVLSGADVTIDAPIRRADAALYAAKAAGRNRGVVGDASEVGAVKPTPGAAT
jgi:PleD family two-component response regulator